MAPTEVLEQVLSHLQAEGARYFGAPGVRLTVVADADREASQVLTVRVAGPADITTLYLKRYKPREEGSHAREMTRSQVARDYEMTARVHSALASRSGFGAVRPIACFPNELVLVTAEVPGLTLSELIERQASWVPGSGKLAELGAVLARVGGWLRAFQDLEPHAGPLSMGDMREYLDVRLRRLRGLRRPVITEDEREAVLRHFDSAAAGVPGSELFEVLAHADLAPSNVLVDGERVAVIDFAMTTRGGVYLDVARLYTQLEFLTAKPHFTQRVVAAMQRALLDGFESGLSLERPLFRLFVIQHLLCHMSSLARNPAPPVTSLYNSYQLRRHRRWLRDLVD